MPIRTLYLFTAILVISLSLWQQDKNTAQTKSPAKPSRSIIIKLKTGEELHGELVQVNNDTVDFHLKDKPQSVDLDKVSQIIFQPPSSLGEDNKPAVLAIESSLRPKILYTERAEYTKDARKNKIEGTVVLSVVYTFDGRITDIKVVRGLPDGLTENAITAVKKIKFKPAMKDGQPVSVRGNVEFNFSL